VHVFAADRLSRDEKPHPERAEQEIDGQLGVDLGRELSSGDRSGDDLGIEPATRMHGLMDEAGQLGAAARSADEVGEHPAGADDQELVAVRQQLNEVRAELTGVGQGDTT
jgi:hypothetical protein